MGTNMYCLQHMLFFSNPLARDSPSLELRILSHMPSLHGKSVLEHLSSEKRILSGQAKLGVEPSCHRGLLK